MEQFHSFKCVPNILRHLFARNCFARQMGVQDISTNTSTLESIPTVVERVIAILPDNPDLIRYSKAFQVFQCFHTKSGQEQGLGRAFASFFFACNDFKSTHKGYKHLQITQSQLTTDVQDFQKLQEGEKLSSGITDLLHHSGMIS
jgi:hypothetical protein